jgi:hypothetical protein
LPKIRTAFIQVGILFVHEEVIPMTKNGHYFQPRIHHPVGRKVPLKKRRRWRKRAGSSF